MAEGIRIPENADLNDYTTPGNYYCDSYEVAATLSNLPQGLLLANPQGQQPDQYVPCPFVLRVKYAPSVHYNKNSIIQHIDSASQAFNQYERYITLQSSAYGIWVKCVTPEDRVFLYNRFSTNIRIIRDAANYSTFYISDLPDINTSRYRYFLLFYGDVIEQSLTGIHGVIDINNNVVIKYIYKGTSSKTVTVSLQNDKLVIASTSTLYGGITLFWLA